jgi:hypothetical protein
MNKFSSCNTFFSRAEKYLSPCAVSDQTNISNSAKGIVYEKKFHCMKPGAIKVENSISVPLQTTPAKNGYITFLKPLF